MAQASSTSVARWSVHRSRQTITVGNVGTLDLALSATINLPAGYSLVSVLRYDAVVAGAVDNF